MERLKISIGKTYNLGDYKSARLDVGLETDFEIVDEETFSDMLAEVEDLFDTAEKKRGLK